MVTLTHRSRQLRYCPCVAYAANPAVIIGTVLVHSFLNRWRICAVSSMFCGLKTDQVKSKKRRLTYRNLMSG